ncbi:Uncharacterized conserved protein, DUF58 family, contains vWF domain [Paraoerskovia marina]|uniref:Uncharacterized conserved protein, DUF58 family, contains vWF domain n=1 Tax=Paraoerskovia marina TaxID=545619 RepID=A0A1H1TRK1_9CELL|nr:DUF58 domain-containing protein [Paraoerskovia marina]SDS62903.1 Uncharacterized conserved protein, DUF58 family, contains vWF domain [Paraoerskovia marina]
MGRHSRRVRLTSRGVGLVIGGLLLVATGVVLDLSDLVALGSSAVLACLVAVVVASVSRLDRGSAAVHVHRRVEPAPTTRDRPTIAHLRVSAGTSALSRARLARLRLTEQAATELTRGRALDARVRTSPQHLDVSYPLRPPLRGRWPLGPLRVTQTDVFGLVRTRQSLGATLTVAVRPRVHELPVQPDRAFENSRTSSVGVRAPSPDDTMVRDYVVGDDPRRVHWSSAARRGRLIVRADESSATAPATVLFDRGLLGSGDTGRRPASGEWSLELAVSGAVATLAGGQRTRFVVTAPRPRRTDEYVTARSSEGRDRIVDSTVDLVGHSGTAERDASIAATVARLRASHDPGELVFAVLAPLSGQARRAVAGLATPGTHHAVVVAPDRNPDDLVDAESTADALRRAGWIAIAAPRHATVTQMWDQIMEAAR